MQRVRYPVTVCVNAIVVVGGSQTPLAVVVRDEHDVQRLVEVIQERMVDPFQSGEDKLISIASGIVAPASVAENLLDSHKRGQVAVLDFVETRLNTCTVPLFEPVKTLKLTTFASLRKKTINI